MRNYRWQVAALIVSAILFVVTLVTRLTNHTPQVTPSPAPSPTINDATATPSIIDVTDTSATLATDIPAATPAASAQWRSPDGVPTLREALIGDVRRLNPLLALPNSPEADLTALIFEGLTQINTYGESVGALALDWEVGNNGLEYVFRLREDVLWQDGTPFTADDVLLTANLLGSSEFPGLPELRSFWQTIETQKIGPYLVRFLLPQPLASFPAQLTIGILPAHAFLGTSAADLLNHPFNLSPVGTGPYQVEALRSSDGARIDAIDLRVSPVYRARSNEPFQIDRLSFFIYPSLSEVISALNTGEVDAFAATHHADRGDVASLRSFHIFTQIAPRVGMLIFNWNEGDTRFFREQRVRSALFTSLNRAAPLEARLPNRAILANSPLLLNSWAYFDGLVPPSTNVEAARNTLDAFLSQRNAAASADEEETIEDPTRFVLLVTEDPGLRAFAQEIATQWQQIGLEVTIEAVPEAQLLERLTAGDFETAIVELALGADPDVYAYWHVGQHPDGLNYGAAADDRLSETLERARREPSGINRAQLYRQFQVDFLTRAIAIPLYYPLFTYVIRENIDGVQLGFIAVPSDRFRNIGSWRISD